MAEWAADETKPWEELEFDQYGLHAKLQVKTMRALYYKAGKDRLLTIVLVRDTEGGRPDQMFYCTRTGLGRADDPVPLRGALECGGHALQRQADDGPGGPGEPDAAGGASGRRRWAWRCTA